MKSQQLLIKPKLRQHPQIRQCHSFSYFVLFAFTSGGIPSRRCPRGLLRLLFLERFRIPAIHFSRNKIFTNWVVSKEIKIKTQKEIEKKKIKDWNLDLSRRCSGVKPSSLFLPLPPRAWALSRSFSLWLPRDQISESKKTPNFVFVRTKITSKNNNGTELKCWETRD